MKLNHYLTSYTKTTWKLINDLNISTKTIKLFEENIRINLSDLGFDK